MFLPQRVRDVRRADGGYTPTRDGDPDVVGAWDSDTVLRPEVKIVAASWGDSRIMQPDSGVWVTFWSDTDFAAGARSLRQQQRVSPAQAKRLVHAQRAELTWDNKILMQ